MTISSREISRATRRYLNNHRDERDNLAPLLSCLADDAEITSRRATPGHVTCSAAVINAAGQVLVIHHNVLGRWLLSGGHLEPPDTGLLAAARRELAEETGITRQLAISPPELDGLPFDIDLHHIPASQPKGEPAHWHTDFRFAFFVENPSVLMQLEEVSAFAWHLPSSLHTSRLASKITRLAR